MRKISVLLVIALTVACSSADKTSETARTDDTPSVDGAGSASIAVESATRNVSCGCAIEGVGACGNYIEIDEKFVHIANSTDLGLGAMEWCGKEGVTAESSGEIRDGEFFAATLVVTTPGQ